MSPSMAHDILCGRRDATWGEGFPAPLLAIIAVAAVVVLGGLAFLLRPSAPAASAAGAPSAPAAPSSAPLPVVIPVQPSASAAPSASAPRVEQPSAEHIELTILEAPPSTSIFLGALRLGSAPGPIRLKRGDAPLKLTLKAPGYAPQTIEFVPAASGSLEAKLTRPAKAAPVRGGAGDLENPF